MSSLWHVLRSAVPQSWDSLGSLELENKGSVARDHLALERTFLAWLRTSLGLVSLGVAITQLFKLPQLVDPGDGQDDEDDDSLLYLEGVPRPRLQDIERLGKPIGGAFIVLGAVVLVLGARRYFSVQAHLTRGVFPPSRIEVSFTALIVGALIVAALSVIIVGRMGLGS